MSTTLNEINEKVRTLEGTARVTPIKMSDLNNRIDSLSNINSGLYGSYDFPKGGKTITLPIKATKSKINAIVQTFDKTEISEFNETGDFTKTILINGASSQKLTLSRNGSTVTLNIAIGHMSITGVVYLINHD